MSEATSIPGPEGTFAAQRTSTPTSRRTDFWAVVLAGGEGVRLRPLVRSALGDERPKQYVPIFGRRTLLGQTLDRVGIGFPVNRTIVVTMERHAEYIAEEFTGCPHPHIFAQPADRGTAAAILAPTSEIARRDPDATVAYPDSLAVARLPRLAWTDLGSPRRVMAVMDHLGIRPPWADRLTASA
jgi:hypothetical protein